MKPDCYSKAMSVGRRTEEPGAKEYDCVLCLFCLSGQEKDVVASVNLLDCGKALFPQKSKRYRGKNEWLHEQAPILPGYVFVYLKEAEAERIYSLKEIPEVVRILRYGDDGEWRLNGADRAFADWVWEQNGIISTMDAVQIGDRIEIVQTELQRLRGRVARMDRRRKTVMIQMDGAGMINNVWLPYQVIQKIDDSNEGNDGIVGLRKEGVSVEVQRTN